MGGDCGCRVILCYAQQGLPTKERKEKRGGKGRNGDTASGAEKGAECIQSLFKEMPPQKERESRGRMELDG